MTSTDIQGLEIEASPEATADADPLPRWALRIEDGLERASELLNPILVKEARQALKSRQFIATFSLLLVCGWGWSVTGIVSQQGSAYYSAAGGLMLSGYYFVLAIPLLIVVPLTAYRSLVNERDDGTYELVAVSTLSARQIVTGKLGSAILQMLIYYSAISPCIAFSYLLRGIDILTIFSILTYTFLISIVLAVFSLFMATATLGRNWQTLITVALIGVQGAVTWLWSRLVLGVYLDANIPYDDPTYWAANAGIVCAGVSYVALFLACATSRLSFASDNRSSRIRVVLTLQTALYLGWIHYFWRVYEAEFIIPSTIIAIQHWFIIGIIIIGERGELSPRVRRSLPTSGLGRALTTWYLPGSGTGFMFVIGHIIVIVGFAIGHCIAERTPMPVSDFAATAAYILLACYFTIYFGLTRLMVVGTRRLAAVGFAFSFLCAIFVLGVSSAGQFILEYWWNDYRFVEFSPAQISNGFWAVSDFLQKHGSSSWSPTTWGFSSIYFCVPLFALFVVFVNLLSVRREIDARRILLPSRVAADNEEMTSKRPSEVVDPLA